jgi:SCP1.201-like deaminase
LPGVYIPPHHADQSQGKQTQMGIWWPAADSAKLHIAAQAWRDMARALDAIDGAAQTAVMNLLAENQGPAMDAFAAYWQKWSGGNGYLPTCSQACTAMARALDEYAQAVDDARAKVEQLVAEISTAVVLGVVLGVCTVGIATAAAGGVTVGLIAAAEAVGVTLSLSAASIVSGVLVGATFGAVEAMAIDVVAIQPEKILLFHDQKDFNWNEVLQWGELGAAGGFVGGVVGAGLGAGADALPASVSAALATRLGRVGVSGLSGATSSVIIDEFQYGQINPLDVAAGTVGGMAGGGLSGRSAVETPTLSKELLSRANAQLSDVGSELHPNVPVFTQGDRAQGILHVGDTEVPLQSGENGPGIWLIENREGGPGSGLTRAWTHVEGHAAGVMNELKISEAELFVNKQPCGAGAANCRFVLSKLLPDGATLVVKFPADGGGIATWLFQGGVPGWTVQ